MMKKIYRLKFSKSHFGENGLDTASVTFETPRLFSALYLEARKLGGEEIATSFLEMVKAGDLVFSNAFPYENSSENDCEYYLPKPIFSSKRDEKSDQKEDINENRRKVKTLKKIGFIPYSEYKAYLKGEADVDKLSLGLNGFSKSSLDTKAGISRNTDEKTKRYEVAGVFYNQSSNDTKSFGLYFICAFETEEARDLFENLLNALAHTGIGGKRTAGYGTFDVLATEDTGEDLLKMVKIEKKQPSQSSQFILLSTALPQDNELEKSLEDARYLVKRRGGFVYSTTDEMLRKNDIFMLTAGSVFKNTFSGDVYDTRPENYSHPVYTYGKAIFLEV